MSTEALAWALSYAPDVPKHLVSTLCAVANYADDRGRNAAPTQVQVAWHTRKTDRQARGDLAALEATGLIRRGNQDVVLFLPPDRRPVVWDLAMERTRGPRPDASPSGRPAVDNCDRPEADFPPVGATDRKSTSPRSGPTGSPLPPGSPTDRKSTSGRSDRPEVHFPPVDQGERTPDRDESDTGRKWTSAIEVGGGVSPPNADLCTTVLTPDERALHDEAMTVRPAWSPVVLAEVLADPVIRGRPDRALVRLAVLDAAEDPSTFTPRRLLHEGCSSWARAEYARFGGKLRPRTAEPAAVPPRTVPWCRDSGCDETTRTLVDPATGAPLPGRVPCKTCHPYPDDPR